MGKRIQKLGISKKKMQLTLTYMTKEHKIEQISLVRKEYCKPL